MDSLSKGFIHLAAGSPEEFIIKLLEEMLAAYRENPNKENHAALLGAATLLLIRASISTDAPEKAIAEIEARQRAYEFFKPNPQ